MREKQSREETKADQKPALSSAHAGNGKEKKKEKKRMQSFFWCVRPGRGHLLARLRGGSGQTCVRCNNPSSDGLQDQSIITSRENIYIRRVRSRGLRRFTAAFFSPPLRSSDWCGAPEGGSLARPLLVVFFVFTLL